MQRFGLLRWEQSYDIVGLSETRFPFVQTEAIILLSPQGHCENFMGLCQPNTGIRKKVHGSYYYDYSMNPLKRKSWRIRRFSEFEF